MTITFVFSLCCFSGAEQWQKTVNDGFGNTRNDYAWSMATFKGKLYVGTLNVWDRAEIWRSDSGESGTWQRVHKSFLDRSLGIRYLYADGDRAIYACTLNLQGARILRSTDGLTWQIVGRRGLGHMQNTTIRCMTRFGEYLYAGVGGSIASLYRSKDGFEWDYVATEPNIGSQMTQDPLTGLYIINNVMIGELAVFGDYLYAFTWTKDLDYRAISWLIKRIAQAGNQGEEILSIPATPGAFEVWRSKNGVNWEVVVGQDDSYGNGMGFSGYSPENLDNDAVTSVAVFKNHLYLGTEHDKGRTSIWRTAEGTTWEKVLDFYDLGEHFNYYVWRLQPFNGRLFAGTMNLGAVINPKVTGAQIWVSDSGNRNTFSPLVYNGFDGEAALTVAGLRIPKNFGIRSFGVFNNSLFTGTATLSGISAWKVDQSEGLPMPKEIGCEVWKLYPPSTSEDTEQE